MLEDGLRYYPHERHSNMLIYIRIAASLPKKTVRDVAHHLRHMQVSDVLAPCLNSSFIASSTRLALPIIVLSVVCFCISRGGRGVQYFQ